MSHHGNEDQMERWYADCDRERLPVAEDKLRSAVEFIKVIAAANPGGATPSKLADDWLERNGYDCKASRQRAREKRAEQLDAEIACLRAERAKL